MLLMGVPFFFITSTELLELWVAGRQRRSPSGEEEDEEEEKNRKKQGRTTALMVYRKQRI
jgi:hypothetical protein